MYRHVFGFVRRVGATAVAASHFASRFVAGWVQLAGLGLFAVGCGLVALPVGVIVAGVELVVVGVALEVRKKPDAGETV